ncbi:hypothetical protein J4219_05620 [Candidatus Woesearchaeota archaeon]|nr:hypothetical protein [Candidatus Woesearchaeota archaeon]
MADSFDSLSKLQKHIEEKAAQIRSKEMLKKEELKALDNDLAALEAIGVDVEKVTSSVLKEEAEIKEIIKTLSESSLDAYRATEASTVLHNQLNQVLSAPEMQYSEKQKNEISRRLIALFERFGFAEEISKDVAKVLAEFSKLIRGLKEGQAQVTLKIEEVELKALDMLRKLGMHRKTLNDFYRFE